MGGPEVIDDPDLAGLRDAFVAGCVGFNAKDAAAWLDPFHTRSVTYNNGFMDVSAIRAIADAVLAGATSFDVDNVDGRIVGDTAILFGDYRYVMADGSVTVGAFSSTHARVAGEWSILMTHYTPSVD